VHVAWVEVIGQIKTAQRKSNPILLRYLKLFGKLRVECKETRKRVRSEFSRRQVLLAIAHGKGKTAARLNDGAIVIAMR